MKAWVEMKDRFDFEQALLKCWEITDEISLLNKNVLEGKINGGNMTTDEISNFLSGLESIYDHKFDVLWNGFETVIMNIVKENKMLNEECAAMREQLGHGAGKPSLFGLRKDVDEDGFAAIKPNKKGKK
jgi:hypothetical protein